MKTNRNKSFFALINSVLLCSATLLVTPLPTSVSAFERVQGQDKTGKNCERVDTSESSTFGKCESVCKDKEITRDAPNNRWVCQATKTVKATQLSERVPNGGKVIDAGKTPPLKQPATATTKVGKVKKS